MINDVWTGCYMRGWGQELVAEAYSHPAKVSFLLADKIYRHILDEKWVAEGDFVVDPFGGIAGFAYHASYHGLNWIGIELEAKFVALGGQNIALWNSCYAGRFAKRGTAQLVQGDSRRLLNVIREGVMPAGDFSLVVSSPPYIDRVANDSQRTATRDGGDWHKRGLRQMNEGDGQTYGVSDGQLGTMSEGSLAVLDAMQFGYSDTPDNIGNSDGETFWLAAREIVAQTYIALRPGGHACWVVKSFIRNKQIVDFPDQWRQLCESVGFVTLHEHRASLVKDSGTQLGMDSNHKRKRTEHKSFFRRLAENKGSPRIDYEVVYCMEKR